MSNEIKVGTRVRSFDFDSRDLTGERACYVEGVVVDTGVPLNGCGRYKIRVERHVVGGVPLAPQDLEEVVFPPMNGTPTWLGKVTDGVVPLQEDKPEAEEQLPIRALSRRETGRDIFCQVCEAPGRMFTFTKKIKDGHFEACHQHRDQIARDLLADADA